MVCQNGRKMPKLTIFVQMVGIDMKITECISARELFDMGQHTDVDLIELTAIVWRFLDLFRISDTCRDLNNIFKLTESDAISWIENGSGGIGDRAN